MKCILIAKCDVCNTGGMVEIDDSSNKDGDHYPFWYAKMGLNFQEKNRKSMCPKCAERYDALIKAQDEAITNFK